MSLNFLYKDNRTQFKRAEYIPLIVNDARIDSRNLSVNGETYSFSNKRIPFRCGVYEGLKTYGISIGDNITVTDGDLKLISTDDNALNIKRGYKVIFEGEEYSVTDISIKIIINRNTTYQRKTNNKVVIIGLT